MNMSSTIQQLYGIVQQHHWGKMGSFSKVAKLYTSENKKWKVKEDQPYAELLVGTPSKLVNQQSVLGEKVYERFHGLPYVFKVLSIAKARPIQAHPDKVHAERLHAERSDIYKDPNRNSELAIALTRFETLCGFRLVREILQFLRLSPELCTVVGAQACYALVMSNGAAEQSAALRACFSRVILCDKALLQEQLTALVKRVSGIRGKEFEQLLVELLLRLYRQFPGDAGCFLIYFLNYIHLYPGEALFLGPNVPYAYLDGDCVVCTAACSENVVRAGLTLDLIDANTLTGMVKYEPSSVEKQLFEPTPTGHRNELLYRPPVDDFAVTSVMFPVTASTSYEFSVNDSASIVLFIDGAAHVEGESDIEVRSGTILFVPAGTALQLSNVRQDVVAYRATCLL